MVQSPESGSRQFLCNGATAAEFQAVHALTTSSSQSTTLSHEVQAHTTSDGSFRVWSQPALFVSLLTGVPVTVQYLLFVAYLPGVQEDLVRVFPPTFTW
jgi:hypothetical protein